MYINIKEIKNLIRNPEFSISNNFISKASQDDIIEEKLLKHTVSFTNSTCQTYQMESEGVRLTVCLAG